jgi:hypothetical protein
MQSHVQPFPIVPSVLTLCKYVHVCIIVYTCMLVFLFSLLFFLIGGYYGRV